MPLRDPVLEAGHVILVGVGFSNPIHHRNLLTADIGTETFLIMFLDGKVFLPYFIEQRLLLRLSQYRSSSSVGLHSS